MAQLVMYNVFCFLFIILLSGAAFQVKGISIRITALDPNGVESSLLYDGGGVQIGCSSRIDDLQMTALTLGVANDKTNGNFVTIATGNQTIEHQIHVNPTVLGNMYRCSGVSGHSEVAQISYILCSQSSIKPKRICPNAKEFCHMTRNGSAECKPLSKYSCLYGHSDIHKTIRLTVSPKFPAVCAKGRMRKDVQVTSRGLCESLINSTIPPKFVATNRSECRKNFALYICHKECRIRKQVVMIGWNVMDLEEPGSIYAFYEGSQGVNLTCRVTYRHNHSLTFSKSLERDNHRLNNIDGLAEQLRQVSTPAMVDILCIGSSMSDQPEYSMRRTEQTLQQFQYRAEILLFRHDEDLKYELDIEKVGRTGGIIKVSVAPADGLYACIVIGNGECSPTEAGGPQSLKMIGPDGKSGNCCTITAYIGLFASSPRQEYTLIHRERIRRTVRLSRTGYAITMTAECEKCKPAPVTLKGLAKRGGKKSILAVAVTLIVIITVVAIATIAIVIALRWNRDRKSKHQQSLEAEKDPSDRRRSSALKTLVPSLSSYFGQKSTTLRATSRIRTGR